MSREKRDLFSAAKHLSKPSQSLAKLKTFQRSHFMQILAAGKFNEIVPFVSRNQSSVAMLFFCLSRIIPLHIAHTLIASFTSFVYFSKPESIIASLQLVSFSSQAQIEAHLGEKKSVWIFWHNSKQYGEVRTTHINRHFWGGLQLYRRACTLEIWASVLLTH